MGLSARERIRVARAVRTHLYSLSHTRLRELRCRLMTLTATVRAIESAGRKLGICSDRRWDAAADTLLTLVEQRSAEVPFQVESATRGVAECRRTVPPFGELYRDLRQLCDEFERIRYDPKSDELAVTTDAIELEGVYLGPFEIRLHLPAMAEMRYNTIYSVIALDPHPAAGSPHVPHPHISDQSLCPGDAGAAIRKALVTGRLCDFFLLIRSILTVYNPASPYVELDQWSGLACHDCGDVVDGDDLRWCPSCERDFCDDCVGYCQTCDETTCLACLETCPACNEPNCPACRSLCPDCGESICTHCLEHGDCPCRRQDNPQETPHEQRQEPTCTRAGRDTACPDAA